MMPKSTNPIRLISGILVLIVLTGNAFSQTATRIYWTEWRSYNPGSSRIARCDMDGANQETLADGFHGGVGVKDLAVDSASGKLYWANRTDGLIERSNLDGSSRETVFSGVNAIGLALDVGAGIIYWTDYTYSDPRIRRGNLDGTGIEDLVSASSGCQFEGIVLDLVAGHLYWAERMDQQIWRANLNGSSATLLLQCSQGIGHPWGLALANGRIYWATDESIMSATTAGEDIQTLVDELTDSPRSLEMDTEANQLYWVTGSTYASMVQRINLDGTGLETLLSDLYYGYGLALEMASPTPAAGLPSPDLSLENFPNPFNPSTQIGFELQQGQEVRLQMFTLEGALVGTLMDHWCGPGQHTVVWNGCDQQGRSLPSGTFICRLVSTGGEQTRQMTLVR